jgi:hypothetical protein
MLQELVERSRNNFLKILHRNAVKVQQKHTNIHTTFNLFSNYISWHTTFVSGLDVCLFQMEVNFAKMVALGTIVCRGSKIIPLVRD